MDVENKQSYQGMVGRGWIGRLGLTHTHEYIKQTTSNNLLYGTSSYRALLSSPWPNTRENHQNPNGRMHAFNSLRCTPEIGTLWINYTPVGI